MNKRFAALFLALTLCAGLAVPASAAEEPDPPRLSVTLDLPDGYTVLEKTEEYRIREFTKETLEEPHEYYVHTYEVYTLNEEPSVRTFTATPLPLGTKITLDNLYPEQGGQLILKLKAWSDSDGDGVYEERIFRWEANTAYSTTDYTLMPSEKKDSFSEKELIGACGYATTAEPEQSGCFSFLGQDSYSPLSASAEGLYEYFGSDTLMQITAAHFYHDGKEWVTREPEEFCFLVTGSPAFTDVPAGKWYAGAVDWAVFKDITNGTEKGKFSPTQTCTHAQILTFLYRADRGGGKAEAADMDKAVEWAREKGMIDDSFNGGAFCTRADAVNYIWQALGKEDAKASSFTDVPAGAAYAKAVDWAVTNGVTNGTNAAQTEFSPNKVCDRGTIVTFLHRAYVEEARLTA